jgi:CelD/BcsL family acetyltransferase involved in cellulose biosynthesis
MVLMVQMNDLQTTLIDSVAGATPFLQDWRELAGGAPMRSPEWLLTWWQVYTTPQDRLALLIFHEPGGRMVGLAPLYLDNAGRKKSYRLLGVAADCTHHATWLAASGWEVRVGQKVARYLLDNRTQWRRLLFESVDADAAAIDATVRHLVENGLLHHRRQINSCWKIALPATWDEYLDTLSRSLRKRCRKLQRQFFDSGIITLHQARTETELQEGFQILLRLHSARWGSTEVPLGVFGNDRFRRFHEEVAKKLLAGNQLRLAWLERDGKPIAIEYQFVDDKTVYAYQAGLDLSVNDECSPGKLTMMAAIRFAIEQGCESFDLLRGNEPYKSNWRAVPSPCYDLRVWPRQCRGYLAWLVWGSYALAVRWLKPVIPEAPINSALVLFRKLKNTARQIRRSGL